MLYYQKYKTVIGIQMCKMYCLINFKLHCPYIFLKQLGTIDYNFASIILHFMCKTLLNIL
jgi:hypothetical protein